MEPEWSARRWVVTGGDGTLTRVSESVSSLAAVPFEWGTDSLPWIGLATVLVVALGVYQLSRALRHLHALERRLGKLELLERIDTSLVRALDEPREPIIELDLQPLEEALRLLREEQRRHAERVLESLEGVRESLARSLTAPRSEAPAPVVVESKAQPEGLIDRVVNRLLAQGYEQIELVTPTEELDGVFESGGEVRVEARRDGAPHKGRVIVREGRIEDVQLRSSYETFP